jgi:hypothetical protein
MLGLDYDTYTTRSYIWVTYQFGGQVLNSWLNAKTRGQVPRTFATLVEALKKKTLLPNILDNAINSLMALNQAGKKSVQKYTMKLNDFERRSKADMNYNDVLCNRSITKVANVTLKTHAMPHREKSVTLFNHRGAAWWPTGRL